MRFQWTGLVGAMTIAFGFVAACASDEDPAAGGAAGAAGADAGLGGKAGSAGTGGKASGGGGNAGAASSGGAAGAAGESTTGGAAGQPSSGGAAGTSGGAAGEPASGGAAGEPASGGAAGEPASGGAAGASVGGSAGSSGASGTGGSAGAVDCWSAEYAGNCDPVHNDCSGGTTCDLAEDWEGYLVLDCLAKGGAKLGDACDDENGPYCGEGLHCDGLPGKCAKFCCTDGDCSSVGGTCNPINSNQGSLGLCE